MEQIVREVYSSYPSLHRKKLLLLREFIFSIAKQNPKIGKIEETLKWGEPSYLTKNKSGSTIRLAWHKKTSNQCGIYFNCKTNLVSSFREAYGDLFQFKENRAIIFNEQELIQSAELKKCIKTALTYRLHKKK